MLNVGVGLHACLSSGCSACGVSACIRTCYFVPRYPTFVDALRDLDDSLSLTGLFATLPSKSGIQAKVVHNCRRLMGVCACVCVRCVLCVCLCLCV